MGCRAAHEGGCAVCAGDTYVVHMFCRCVVVYFVVSAVWSLSNHLTYCHSEDGPAFFSRSGLPSIAVTAGCLIPGAFCRKLAMDSRVCASLKQYARL